jgi:hypothetical protein
MKKVWTFNPHAGGKPIPPGVQESTRKRILAHVEAHYPGQFVRLRISFKGKFCYIDAFVEPRTPSEEELSIRGETLNEYQERLRAFPIHLCRLFPPRFNTFTHHGEYFGPVLF